MQTALVLTAEAAEKAGLTGGGPFTFAGSFPGIWEVDQPVAVSELGLEEEEAVSRAEALGLPLETTTVADGEGLIERENHVRSAKQIAEAEKADAVADATGGSSSIRTHRQADKVAADLGISFDEGLTVAQKVEAIESFNAAAAADVNVPAGKDDDESVADAQHDAATEPPADEEPQG